MSASYINGLQEGGVGVIIKHFVANEQETWRMMVNTIVEERPLRELYLKPFKIAVREAKPWAVISSYNIINGQHADMNEFTLKKVLRVFAQGAQTDKWLPLACNMCTTPSGKRRFRILQRRQLSG